MKRIKIYKNVVETTKILIMLTNAIDNKYKTKLCVCLQACVLLCVNKILS